MVLRVAVGGIVEYLKTYDQINIAIVVPIT